MLQNAYFLAKIGADTAENEQHFAEFLPKTGNYPTGPCGAFAGSYASQRSLYLGGSAVRLRKGESLPLFFFDRDRKNVAILRGNTRICRSGYSRRLCNIFPWFKNILTTGSSELLTLFSQNMCGFLNTIRFPISKKIFHNIDFERCIFQIGRKMHFACLRVHNFENKMSEAFEAREILLEFEVRSAEWCWISFRDAKALFFPTQEVTT